MEVARDGAGEAKAEGEGEDEDDEPRVFPIAWFRFHSADEASNLRPGIPESGRMHVALRQPRCTGMVLAKLVAPENRMEMMHDDHAEPNIDLEFGAFGHPLPPTWR